MVGPKNGLGLVFCTYLLFFLASSYNYENSLQEGDSINRRKRKYRGKPETSALIPCDNFNTLIRNFDELEELYGDKRAAEKADTVQLEKILDHKMETDAAYKDALKQVQTWRAVGISLKYGDYYRRNLNIFKSEYNRLSEEPDYMLDGRM
ncbi:hypothetical protein WAI453_001750 [Rhynchosporium graminicola]